MRLYLSAGWETVTKWELLEPVQHRPPIPEPLVEAMIVLALKWGWKTWAGCTALCFYGACRIGEVLNAKRQHLLTPSDLLSDEVTIYFRIVSPKTRRRGAVTQYTTVDHPFWAELISSIFKQLSSNDLLYCGNQSAYRTRFEAILKHIGVGKIHRLTPGSLRAGGTIAAHKHGLGISDLLWKLRLQHQKTLSHYLQEATAVSLLPALTAEVRMKIQLLRCFLPRLRHEARSAYAQ